MIVQLRSIDSWPDDAFFFNNYLYLDQISSAYPQDAVEDVRDSSATPSPCMINYYNHYASFSTDEASDVGGQS
jgi:hypothetical protein